MRLIWLTAFLMLLALGCASNESADQGSAPRSATATDLATMEQLVTRLFTPPFATATDVEREPQVLLGEMPPELGARMPDGAIILGSVLQSDGGFQAIVDLPLNQADGAAFYNASLAAAGWRETQRSDQPGFNTGDISALGYCSDRDIILQLILSDSPVENFTEAHFYGLRFDTSAGSFCEQDEAGDDRSNGRSPRLPSLSSPPGVVSSGSTSSASAIPVGAPGADAGSSTSVEEKLTTDLSAADLEEHYRRQLEALGWDLVDLQTAGSKTTSTWRFTDEEGEEHQGLLWVVERPGVDQRTAFLEVTRPVK